MNPAPVNRTAGTEARPGLPAGTGRRRDLYLLSGDDGLLLELGPLLGERYRTRPIDSAEPLNQAGTSPWLLIIDATARADARAQAARIEQQHPHVPLIVICADGKAADWASALARGMVSAVIERGAVPSGALSDALQAAEQRLDARGTAGTGHAAANLDWPGTPAAGRRKWLWLLPIALALAAAGAWLVLQTPAPRPAAGALPTGPAAPIPPAPQASGSVGPTAVGTVQGALPPAAPARSVLELLSDARVAFRDGKNLLPRGDGSGHGDSALELYAAALAQDPQNDEARDGLRRLFSVARARIQADLAAGRLDDATRLLAAFHDAGVNDEATARMDADIAAARPRWLVAQARSALARGDTSDAAQLIAQIEAGGGDHAVLTELHRALESRSAEAQLTELAARTRANISTGALLEPPADNARAHLAAMQQLNRNLALTAAVQHELMGALIGRAQAAGRAAQYDVATQYLNAAAEYGSTNELTAARRQLQAALDAARAASAAAAVPARSEPQSLNAAVPAAAAPRADYIAAKPLRALDAVYPPRALDRGQSGYVVVEFMLDAKGRPSEPRVIESSPPAVFDNAALAAVRKGRFDVSAVGAVNLPQRARLRITFKP